MRKRSKLLIILLVVLAATIGAFQTPIMSYARGKTWDIITISVGKVFGISDIQTDDSLQTELARLRAENVSLQSQLKDYGRLRKQIGTSSIADLRPVPAAVVSRTVDAYQTKFIIARGITDGITVGNAVTIFDNVLIGVVTKADEHSAEVTSLFHPDVSVTAETTHEDEEALIGRGLVTSEYFSTIRLTTVPKDTPLVSGQQIVTVADGKNIPYGLVIGSIFSIESQEYEPYQSARITVPYDLDTVDAVSVLAQP